MEPELEPTTTRPLEAPRPDTTTRGHDTDDGLYAVHPRLHHRRSSHRRQGQNQQPHPSPPLLPSATRSIAVTMGTTSGSGNGGDDDEREEFNKMEIRSSDDLPLNRRTNSGGAGTGSGGKAAILGDIQGAGRRLGPHQRRQYLAAALIAAGFLFLLIVYLVVRNARPNSSEDAEEAVSEIWDELPDAVREMVDREVNPCEDFYQFSCGKWLAAAEIPADKSAVFASFTTVNDANELVLQEIMKENLPYLSELFGTCMNMSAINATGAAPLKPLLQRIQGTTDVESLFRLVGELSVTGPDFLTGLSVQPDSKDATVYALFASQSGLTLPDPKYYLDKGYWEDVSGKYREFISRVFTLAGSTAADAKTNEDTVINFEMALAKIYIPKEELMDPTKTYNPVALDVALKAYPIVLGAYLKGTGIPAIMAQIPGAKAPQKNMVSIETPQFFANVEKLVAKTPLAELKVIYAFHVLRDYAPHLSDAFVQASFELFAKHIGGQKQLSPRWKACQRRVTVHFPDLMGKYYFIKKFDGASEALAKDMVQRIEAAMSARIDDVDWLDGDTEKAALKKMSQVANLIGHSSKEEHFPFVLREDSYWDNVQTLGLYHFNRSVNKIGLTVDRDEWHLAASEVNAYYNPSANQIVFPAGILQPPFFDRKRHPAQNYGAIGAIIGHEITHGFDDQGRYYDGDGNLVDWWNDDTDKTFRTKAQCLVDQYSGFKVTSEIDGKTELGHVNGNYTLGENIADNGGVKLAFEAMSKYLFHRTEDEELQDPHQLSRPAAEQLFFLSFAQAFCAKSSDEALVRRINTDPHSPERWRVNGVMKNSADFARVFECPADAPMTPAKRCEVW